MPLPYILHLLIITFLLQKILYGGKVGWLRKRGGMDDNDEKFLLASVCVWLCVCVCAYMCVCVTERERERKQKKERVREREQERNKRVHDRVSHIRWAGELMEVRLLFRCVHASLISNEREYKHFSSFSSVEEPLIQLWTRFRGFPRLISKSQLQVSKYLWWRTAIIEIYLTQKKRIGDNIFTALNRDAF